MLSLEEREYLMRKVTWIDLTDNSDCGFSFFLFELELGVVFLPSGRNLSKPKLSSQALPDPRFFEKQLLESERMLKNQEGENLLFSWILSL